MKGIGGRLPLAWVACRSSADASSSSSPSPSSPLPPPALLLLLLPERGDGRPSNVESLWGALPEPRSSLLRLPTSLKESVQLLLRVWPLRPGWPWPWLWPSTLSMASMEVPDDVVVAPTSLLTFSGSFLPLFLSSFSFFFCSLPCLFSSFSAVCRVVCRACGECGECRVSCGMS
jgi:hypothetical protein